MRFAAVCLTAALFALADRTDAAIWYVATNGNDSAAGTNWLTAKQTIQAAIDIAVSNDTVLVSNGVYATGGVTNYPAPSALTNRVAINKPLTVQSLNGPAVTIIQGMKTYANDSIRCVYVGNNAVLSGFTLSSGGTRSAGDESRDQSGGGAFCEASAVLSNCVLTLNSASRYGGGCSSGTLYNSVLAGNYAVYRGGGAAGATLNDCILTNNNASSGGGADQSVLNRCVLTGNGSGTTAGGGAYQCVLNNCLLKGNWAANYGGGSYYCTLNNCILNSNRAGYYGGNSSRDTLNNCITFDPDPYNSPVYSTGNYSCLNFPPDWGVGNITNNPQFVNANAGNYRLAAGSPCIDRGNNAYVQGTADMDGNPRILNGIVDMGAYEFQYNAGYWAWASAITNGLTNLGQCATGDGYPNLLKYATGSSATNSDDLPRLDASLSNNSFSAVFNRNTNASDATLIVEGATSVSNGAAWNGIATNFIGSWGDATNVVETGATNPVGVIVNDPSPATNRFLRLRVTRP